VTYITHYDTVYLAKELKGNCQGTVETASLSSKRRIAGWCWWWEQMPYLVGSDDGS